MKLINAGFGRTGTTSLKEALKILDYGPIHHSTDLLVNSKQLDVFEAAMKGETVDWRAFYADYEVADWPAGLCYRDIINAHPSAKVMITVRDPEAWFESGNNIFNQFMSIKLPIPRIQRIKSFLKTYALDGMFEGKYDDKEFMVQFFKNHVAEVKAFVPADRLLVYDVREGWEPLCAFLEVDVPQQPFPRANKGANFKDFATKLLSGGA